MNERVNLVAPCGIDCGICELYTCRDNQELFDHFVSRGISKDKIPCNGCRPIEGKCPMMPETCETYTCVSQKGINFCSECNEFPCVNLHPASDRAELLPHNMKVYNLCKIKNYGVENFVNDSSEIKRRYYKGKMVIGKGPQL